MRILLLLIFCSFVSFSASAYEHMEADTTGKGLLSSAAIPAKLLAAKHEHNEGNYRGSLVILRDVIEADPSHALAHMRIAHSYFELKKYSLAKRNAEKAVGLDQKLDEGEDFFFAQLFHYTEDLDNAIFRYTRFRENEKRGDFFDYAGQLIEQCEYAKVQMENPVSVEVTNLGRDVNSRYEDYAPSVTADGNTLVFTSRRNTTTGGNQDKEGDYKFFEDVLITSRASSIDPWSEAEPIPGGVNTDYHDAVLSIHPNGSQMFIYKNSDSEAADIFISEKNNETNAWGTPQRMPKPINTSYFEGSVSITGDGNTIYFVSERPGGLGSGDIYKSQKVDGKWSSPESLGEVVNTFEDEKFVFIHPDGRTLYFASEGHQNMGSYDIFKTELVDGVWSAPLNLGYPINTVNEESTFSITADYETMYISAEYEGGNGERDIYAIDVSNYQPMQGSKNGQNSGTLYLKLTNAGNSVKKQLVEIVDPVNGLVVLSGMSDEKGAIRFVLPSDKEYLIQVARKKKDPISKSIMLKSQDGKPAVERVELSL